MSDNSSKPPFQRQLFYYLTLKFLVLVVVVLVTLAYYGLI